MKNRILAFSIICLILVSISLNVFSVNEVENSINLQTNTEVNTQTDIGISENKTLEEQKAEVDTQIEESNSKLEYVQSEMSDTLQKVEELEDSILSYQSQYDELVLQINNMQTEINETDKEIAEIEDEYNRKEKVLKKRVVALYESGDTTYIDLLLASNSIIDFISNYFLVGELVAYDTELLNELENTKNRIETKKSEQEAKQKQLREAKIETNKMQILMENTKVVKENYMAELTDEERILQEQIASYKAEQQEIENQILAAIDWTGTLSIQFTGGVMIWPIAMEGTYITSDYGNRLHPIQGVYKDHDGLDIAGPNVNGAPIVATADGIVSYAGWITGYGNCVIINHGSGIFTLYGHGSEIITTLGATVKQGDIIMKVGSTGNSTGPHVHFEVRKNGVTVDPKPYLNGEVQNVLDNTNSEIINNNQIINTNEIISSN